MMGNDSAVFIVCDNLGFCDTTILYLTTFSRPHAEDDIVSVENNTTVLIPVLNNDNWFVGNGFVSLLNSTQDGEIIVSMDNKVSFRAYSGVCNRSINPVRYKVCNAAGCDTAILYIYVTCKEVKDFEIFNAVSPNGDGLNDVFKIEGVHKYPNNRLQIYNRWGALVYDATKYNNDWDGSWNNYILPDGTYFYVLDLGNGSSAYSGYLELHR
jgi:gliding motility-associated-like protein